MLFNFFFPFFAKFFLFFPFIVQHESWLYLGMIMGTIPFTDCIMHHHTGDWSSFGGSGKGEGPSSFETILHRTLETNQKIGVQTGFYWDTTGIGKFRKQMRVRHPPQAWAEEAILEHNA